MPQSVTIRSHDTDFVPAYVIYRLSAAEKINKDKRHHDQSSISRLYFARLFAVPFICGRDVARVEKAITRYVYVCIGHCDLMG